jgi:hypothetical protein
MDIRIVACTILTVLGLPAAGPPSHAYAGDAGHAGHAGHAEDEVSFVARADRTRVTVGEVFTYEVTLSLPQGRATGYQHPRFRGFRMLREQPSHPPGTEIGGTATFRTSVYSWRYKIAATTKGSHVIDPARVRVGGHVGSKALTTNHVTVLVTPVGSPPSPRGLPEKNFLHVSASQTRVKVGEPVTVEWFLYLGVKPTGYTRVTEPVAHGFRSEDLPLSVGDGRGLQLTPGTFEGTDYLVAPVLRRVFSPLRAGKLVITAMEVDVSRINFLGTQLRSERLTSNPIAIEAMALPAGTTGTK